MTRDDSRTALREANRIVVKAGSRVLVRNDGRPNPDRLDALVHDLCELKKQGKQILLVSSGAVGAGMEALGLKIRPVLLPELQMAAAVGQSRLMAEYSKRFRKKKLNIGQILLTHDDLKNRKRHINARNTLLTLLNHDIIPVINENDVIATEEIRFGDNDQLAALVSTLVDADLMILLTTVNGLREPAGGNRTRRVPHVKKVDRHILQLAQGKESTISIGGMASKLSSAQMAVDMGIPTVIANGTKASALQHIVQGKDEGTLIGSGTRGDPIRSARKRWIAYFHRAAGTLIIDAGAAEALRNDGKSLLPIGIRNVIGEFPAGSMVNIRNPDDDLIARGLTDYSSADIERIRGKKTDRIMKILGHMDYRAVVHRNNMLILHHGSST